MTIMVKEEIVKAIRKYAGCSSCNSYDGLRCKGCNYGDAILAIDSCREMKCTYPIDAGAPATLLLWDVQYDEEKLEKTTVAGVLDAATEEGCPPSMLRPDMTIYEEDDDDAAEGQ